MKSLDLIKLLKFHENTNQETRFLEKTTNKHFNFFFSLMVPPPVAGSGGWRQSPIFSENPKWGAPRAYSNCRGELLGFN